MKIMKAIKIRFVQHGIYTLKLVLAVLITAFAIPEAALAKSAYADSQGRLGLAGPAIANAPKGGYTGRSRAQAGAVVVENPIVAGLKFPGLNDTQRADAEDGDALALGRVCKISF